MSAELEGANFTVTCASCGVTATTVWLDGEFLSEFRHAMDCAAAAADRAERDRESE